LDDPPPDTRDKIGEGLGEEPSTQVTIEISAFRKVLKTRSFMALWIGQGISSIGDWVIVGVLLDTVNRANPTWGVFFMLTFRFLPAFLFGLAAGAVVDRLERKTLMILCEISRCLLVIVLAFANSLVLICALVFTIECFSLLFGPAKDSSIPDLVKPDEVMTANSMMSTSTYLSMALGTLIATVILGLAALIHKFPLVHYVVANEATFQHEFAFIVDALTFLMSAMLLFTIAFPKRTTVTGQKFSARSIFSDLKEGLSFMRTNPLTRGILGIMIVGFIGGGSLYVLGAPFAQQVLNSVAAKFTLILSGLMIGVVAGAAATPWLSRYLPAWKWFTRAVIGFGVSMFVFALVDFYALSLVVHPPASEPVGGNTGQGVCRDADDHADMPASVHGHIRGPAGTFPLLDPLDRQQTSQQDSRPRDLPQEFLCANARADGGSGRRHRWRLGFHEIAPPVLQRTEGRGAG
jgi:dTMP kinase